MLNDYEVDRNYKAKARAEARAKAKRLRHSITCGEVRYRTITGNAVMIARFFPDSEVDLVEWIRNRSARNGRPLKAYLIVALTNPNKILWDGANERP